MPIKYTYLFINLGTILVPFIFSFYPTLKFHKTWKAFFPANLLVALVFVVWDIIFTKAGVWGFNPDYLCGLYIYNLPLEEVLFFLCIPYASVFTYYCFTLFFKRVALPVKPVTGVVILFLSVVAMFNMGRLYTSVTFLALTGFLVFVLLNKQLLKWLPHFYLSYAVILLPFVIVNGILTGSWIDEPVVWYNNAENLGVRLLTIPFEDVFYGMLLLILNVGMYEWFRQRQASGTAADLSV